MSHDRPQALDPAAAEHILRQLKDIVPAAFSEGRFDPHALAEILGLAPPNPHESYRLRWPGKDRALDPLRHPLPIALDPKPERSLDYDKYFVTSRNFLA